MNKKIALITLLSLLFASPTFSMENGFDNYADEYEEADYATEYEKEQYYKEIYLPQTIKQKKITPKKKNGKISKRKRKKRNETKGTDNQIIKKAAKKKEKSNIENQLQNTDENTWVFN